MFDPGLRPRSKIDPIINGRPRADVIPSFSKIGERNPPEQPLKAEDRFRANGVIAPVREGIEGTSLSGGNAEWGGCIVGSVY